jgi:hypothetical protein
MKIKHPRHGQVRYIKKFAFLPIETSRDNYSIWLENAYIRQVYFYGRGWRSTNFVPKDTYEEKN